MKKLIILSALLKFLTFSGDSFSQCENAEKKYQELICKLEEVINSSYDTLQVREHIDEKIPLKMKELNKANCIKIDKIISELNKELNDSFKEGDYALKELIKTYISGLKIYVNSLRDETLRETYSLFNDQFCTSNYQQSQTAKGQLLNYIHFLEITPPPPITNKFQFSLAFGSSFSSIEKNLLASATSLNYDSVKSINKNTLFYDFSFGYKVSEKFRAGVGVNNIPETSIGYKNGSSDIEEKIHGTSLRITGNYLLLPYKKEKLGVELSLTGGIVGSFIKDERSISSSYSKDSITTYSSSTYIFTIFDSDGDIEYQTVVYDTSIVQSYQMIRIENESSHQINSLGIALSLHANVYLNKNISFFGALGGMLNSKIKIPEQSYGINNTEKILGQTIGFNAFSVSAGMAVHF